jgi:hypothetical protein
LELEFGELEGAHSFATHGEFALMVVNEGLQLGNTGLFFGNHLIQRMAGRILRHVSAKNKKKQKEKEKETTYWRWATSFWRCTSTFFSSSSSWAPM